MPTTSVVALIRVSIVAVNCIYASVTTGNKPKLHSQSSRSSEEDTTCAFHIVVLLPTMQFRYLKETYDWCPTQISVSATLARRNPYQNKQFHPQLCLVASTPAGYGLSVFF